MKVEQFLNRNQFHLYGEFNGEIHHILQSYDSKVVEIINKDGYQLVTLGRDWDYSTTTSKHVYAFLKEYLDYGFNFRPDRVKNKRKYVQSLIDDHTFGYSEEMY